MTARAGRVSFGPALAGALIFTLACTLTCTLACTPASPPPSTPPPPPPVVAIAEAPTSTATTRAMALRGEFPPGPEVASFSAKCMICHTTAYISQQRLTAAQWEKTVKKMRGWGAPIDDAEVAALSRYFAVHFPVDLPDPVRLAVAPPAGAVP